MEFYYVIALCFSRKDCGFNSQRDGILLATTASRRLTSTVSIPNGMEFYYITLLIHCRAVKVSIPNGMEFYAHFLKNLLPFLEFQFPTGWNSTNSIPGFIQHGLKVSIPNGMEFY